MRARLLAVCLGLAASSCASYTALAPEDRANLSRDLSGKDADKYLKLSFYVTPFFGDASKKLLSALPSDEVRMLDDTGGAPISPGTPESITSVGTRVRVQQIEFPTSWVVAGRVPYTPRTQPWVYLFVEGQPKEQVFILVLRPKIRTRDEFLAEVERYLTSEDPARTLSQWSPLVREAVKSKNALQDMPAEALEMAWGYPETKQITWDQQVKKEKWVYPGGKRVVYLVDGRISSVEDKK
jgi:hypothetical protein